MRVGDRRRRGGKQTRHYRARRQHTNSGQAQPNRPCRHMGPESLPAPARNPLVTHQPEQQNCDTPHDRSQEQRR